MRIDTIAVVLATLIVESMSNLMTNDPTNATIIHVFWPILVEEDALDGC
jgi:hypothetical protein